MTAQDILNTLKTAPHTVTFRKANGELRTLIGYAPQEIVLRSAGIVPIVEWGTHAYKSFKVENLVSMIEFNPYV
jgi:hypothetical protein